MKLVIGDKNLSSWSLRPWLVMRQAEIPFEEEVLRFDREDFRDAVAALSPARRVPVLRDGDLVVWDSLAICEHLAERFPDRGLWPDDQADRARARSLTCEMHSGFASLRTDLCFDVGLRAPRRPLSTETEAEVRRVLEIWSGARGPFLFGRFSIADAMFAPVVLRFRSYDVPVEDAAARRWYETMLALPAMAEWRRDAEAEPRGGTLAPGSGRDCFAVVFSSQLRGSAEGYGEAAERMTELAALEPGFLGIESARRADGFGITVSYWDSLEAVRRWRDHAAHKLVQARGRESFYAHYDVRVARVLRAYRHQR